MKHLIFIALAIIAMSCADQGKRQKNLAVLYPGCKIEPATGLIQQNGYNFIAIDTTGQIVAIQFYPWSETKIMGLRNIR
jgi:hypothetical protein